MLMPSIFGESLLDDFFDEFNGGTRNRVRYAAPSNGVMRTDIKESADDYEISIDLPGYQKEDVQAELKDGYLVISAKNERSTDDSDGKTFVRRERFYGTCSRSFYVGKDITEKDIHGKYENGILMLDIPKKAPEKKVEEKKFVTIEG